MLEDSLEFLTFNFLKTKKKKSQNGFSRTLFNIESKKEQGIGVAKRGSGPISAKGKGLFGSGVRLMTISLTIHFFAVINSSFGVQKYTKK